MLFSVLLKSVLLISCVFLIFFQNAGSQLCFRIFFSFLVVDLSVVSFFSSRTMSVNLSVLLLLPPSVHPDDIASRIVQHQTKTKQNKKTTTKNKNEEETKKQYRKQGKRQLPTSRQNMTIYTGQESVSSCFEPSQHRTRENRTKTKT